MDEVVLVNELDEVVGTMEKMAAHREPVLHRAFSVFLFNTRQELLIQQRANTKYHSAGLWTNTCCSHPRPGEQTVIAARRRLAEEMGLDTPVNWAFNFIYQAGFDNGLFEYEFDHVYTGIYDGPVEPDPNEVADFTYRSLEEIRNDMVINPDRYTAWFKIALPKVESYLAQNPSAVC